MNHSEELLKIALGPPPPPEKHTYTSDPQLPPPFLEKFSGSKRDIVYDHEYIWHLLCPKNIDFMHGQWLIAQ